MTAVICVVYTLGCAAFAYGLWREDRQLRAEENLLRHETEAGIARLEQYANTGKASL